MNDLITKDMTLNIKVKEIVKNDTIILEFFGYIDTYNSHELMDYIIESFKKGFTFNNFHEFTLNIFIIAQFPITFTFCDENYRRIAFGLSAGNV